MVRESHHGWTEKLSSHLRQDLPSAVLHSMEPVEDEARRQVYLGHPNHLEKQTGRLQESISTELEGNGMEVSASVGSNLVYAPVHELGAVITDKHGTTRIIPPRPFLVPAFAAKKNEVRENVNRQVSKIIRSECP